MDSRGWAFPNKERGFFDGSPRGSYYVAEQVQVQNVAFNKESVLWQMVQVSHLVPGIPCFSSFEGKKERCLLRTGNQESLGGNSDLN